MLARCLALVVVVVGAVACSAAEDSAKKPLPVCDAKDSDCPGVKSSAPKVPHQEVPTDPVVAPPATTEPPPKTEPSTPIEAGVDAAPVVGPQCQGLAACCKQLGEAGYVTTTCVDVLSTNNENACSTQHTSYKSFGDCS